MEKFYYALVFTFVTLLTIVYLLTLKKLKNTTIQLQMIASNQDFERDIHFLLYMIDFKCKNMEQFIASTRQSTSKTMLTDALFNETVTNLVLEIKNSLNDNYKALLIYKYFSNEELEVYISQNVIMRMTKLFTHLNNAVIRGMNNNVVINRSDV